MFAERCSIIIAVLLLAAGAVWADGDCDRSAWGHDEAWQEYNAGGLMIETRTCASQYGSSYIDVKNPYDYDICVTVAATSSNMKWSNWPVRAGQVLSHQTGNKHEVWRVGAKRMIGTYCK